MLVAYNSIILEHVGDEASAASTTASSTDDGEVDLSALKDVASFEFVPDDSITNSKLTSALEKRHDWWVNNSSVPGQCSQFKLYRNRPRAQNRVVVRFHCLISDKLSRKNNWKKKWHA